MFEAQKKYEFTDEVHPDSKQLKRIRAVRSFEAACGYVNTGDLGGWIESEDNLSHKGRCWVGGEAVVIGQSKVTDNAIIKDKATVISSIVRDFSSVLGETKIVNSVLEHIARAGGSSSLRNGVVLRGRIGDRASAYGKIEIANDVRLNATMYICFSLTETPPAVLTTDDYTMTLDKANGKVSAGCRYFTFDEAIAHWKNTRGGTPLGEERLKQVEFLRSFM